MPNWYVSTLAVVARKKLAVKKKTKKEEENRVGKEDECESQRRFRPAKNRLAVKHKDILRGRDGPRYQTGMSAP